MKIKPYEIEKFLTRIPSTTRALVLFGPDEGAVRLNAERAVKNILGENADPFNLRSLSAKECASEPALLAREAGNLSLGGGRVVVRVRAAVDNCTKALEQFLAAENAQGLVVMDSGNLTPRSSLRALAEKNKQVAALACYADDPQKIAALIQKRLKEAALAIERDALITLTQRLGSDRAVTENEIEKLILYMGSAKKIQLEDVFAASGDMATMSLDGLADCAALGEIKSALRHFDKLIAAGYQPIVILNHLSRHFQKLRWVLNEKDGRGDLTQNIARLSPPIHFSRKEKFLRQCRIWNLKQTAHALELLWRTNKGLRGQSPASLCSHALLSIGQRAQKLAKI